ncbi:MAG: GtrA family protein [Paracoccaceae bacterium]
MFHIFILCSGTAALVNLAVGYLLYGVAGFAGPLTYPLSVAFAFACGMAVSFVLNRQFTYDRSGRAVGHEMRDFFLVSLVGLFLNTGIAWGLYAVAPGAIAGLLPVSLMPETAAHLTAVAITAIYSFLAHKWISFGRADAKWRTRMKPRNARAGGS